MIVREYCEDPVDYPADAGSNNSMRVAESNIAKINLLSRFALGLMFLIAALTKGIDVVRFGRRVEIAFGTYGVAETEFWIILALVTGCLILLLEFLLGGMLISGYRSRLAGILAAGLLLIFLIKLFWELINGQNHDCGCFGTLIERSAGEALIENLIFLSLSGLVIFTSHRDTESLSEISHVKRKRWTVFTLGFGIFWIIFFNSTPVFSSVVRTGSSWDVQLSDTVETVSLNRLVWLLDPECTSCRSQVDLLNELSKTDHFPVVTGLAFATPGRIREFSWDFEILFEIKRITEDENRRIYLPSGSLILIVGNRVGKIWRPGMIPSTPEEIIKVMQ